MYSLRTTKTKSGATAVQVVEYRDGQTIVHKHVASTHNLSELPFLFQAGHQWIEQTTGQLNLFLSPQTSDNQNPPPTVLLARHLQAVRFQPNLLRQVFSSLWSQMRFDSLADLYPTLLPLLSDLTLMRLVKPSSKREALATLTDWFGITYRRSDVYRKLAAMANLQPAVERLMIEYAKTHLQFNFTLVFYDVTTLYFESFEEDTELKQYGFSKDNRSNQPQLIIGLVVNDTGFPIGYHIFAGNTFEGHTLLPVLLALKQKYEIRDLTVVADAAMISDRNVTRLKEAGLKYIVGARMGNLRRNLITQISQTLNQEDGKTLRLKTSRGNLICGFSKSRYTKDKHDTEKQIEKANYYLHQPSKAVKKLKFLTIRSKNPTLNQKLIAKTRELWGIKGYYTNTDLSDQAVIDQYRNLWHVEQSFRLTKSDLKARPIYVQKTKTIQAHLLICFMALAIAKIIEEKTHLSLKKAINLLLKVQDITIEDTRIGTKFNLKSQLSGEVENILQRLGFTY